MRPLIDIRDLTISFNNDRRKNAVDAVSFTVEEGSTLGIIGESGAGKTTLAYAVAGLTDTAIARISGSVMFDGRDLITLRESELCQVRGSGVTMIFQDASGSLDPSMPVLNQVAEAIMMHQQVSDQGVAMDEALRVLAEVGVSAEVLKTAPFAHRLSGGLCQRVMIAVALACRPKLLVADEPTSSLDVITQAQIVKLIVEKKRAENLTMIFISHDLAIVSDIADYLLVMRQGRVVEWGEASQLVRAPCNQYTRSLISAWDAAAGWAGIDYETT